jgi:FkbM family methyltransferase
MLGKIIAQIDLKTKRILSPNGRAKVLKFHDISLKINEIDAGGKQYDSRKSFEEILNPLYKLIQQELNPSAFLDIGANYGFISIIAAKYFPSAKLILVEPGVNLAQYIKDNMALNNITNYEFIDAICGEEEKTDVGFAINPYSSQDNRVVAPRKSWKVEMKKMVSIDGLLGNVDSTSAVFVKIDVQGFEEMVFKGGKRFFSTHKNWVAKSEFAPQWLSSQGSDATKMLAELVDHYEVVELTGRTPYQTKTLSEIFMHPLTPAEVKPFIQYITDLDRNGRGWCDILLRPRK